MVESMMTRPVEGDFLVQRDWRADGGARRVRVTRSDILIARRFGGIDMRIQIPVPAYRGVFLDIVDGDDGAPLYRLLLAHVDRDLDVLLEETRDRAAAEAGSGEWAAWLDLPLLAATMEDAACANACDTAGAPRARRGGSALRRRRPRFLMRRLTGEAARLEAIFSGEREIVCYE